MALNQGNRRWPAGVLLLALAAVYGWIGRRPPRSTAGSDQQPAAVASPEAAPALATLTPPSPAEVSNASAAPAVSAPPIAETVPAVPPPEPALRFSFPTDNQFLTTSQPERFFMFVDRYLPTGLVEVWQGGSYGFVRNPRETLQGTVFTKFHEGIDIAPILRDAKGEPQDEVRAIADGVVGYVTANSSSSNYGNYIVVLHQVGEAGVFYSLYAHLRSTDKMAGAQVTRGDRLGMLGYTGAGIDRRRAHVHLEIGLILSERFDVFYGGAKGLANGHGNFHGSNLLGFNGADFLTANRADPQLMPQDFLAREEVYYKVLVPNRGHELEIVQRHAWLRRPGPAAAAWEISFTGPGVPVAVAPAAQAVTFATVSWVKTFAGYHSWNTRSLLGGSGSTATLSGEGNKFITLVAGDF